MATLFTRIIEGELPARFVYQDEKCVAFLSLHPLQPGHTLVVPREEVDHWLDLDRETLERLHLVAQRIGRAQMKAFAPERVGLMIAGLEVPHVHLHVVPMNQAHDLDFARQNANADAADLDSAAEQLREALALLGE